jgi:TetR/AcrR family transcriptional regulator
MRLSTEQRRQQLIRAAMRLFALKGFDGTTTREIARAARINEAIIFRHFPSKEALYWAVVSSRIQAAGRQKRMREYLDSADLNIAQALAGIAENLLDRTREDAELTRLLIFSALRNSRLSDSFFRTYMSGTYRSIANFIRRGIKAGQFRKVDPMLGARTFLGLISSHILLDELFGGGRDRIHKPGVLGRQLADLWLNGMASPTSKAHGVLLGGNAKRNGHAVSISQKPREFKNFKTINLRSAQRNGSGGMESNQ